MAITTAQFAADYAALLEAQGVVLTDRPLFVATFAGQLTDWLGGGDAIPAELAYRLKQTLGYWNAFASGMVGFLTIDAEGGPNGDGTVTIVDGLGVTHTIDSLSRLVLEMAGIIIRDTLGAVGDLPAVGQRVGDIYIIGGDGYLWTGAAWVNIGPIRGPKGDAATIAVGAVDTVAPGAPATVVNSGTAAAAVLNFDIPQGVPGEAATLAVGVISTGPAGSAANVVNAGTPNAAVLDFTIPRGDKGDKGDAATVAAGNVVTVAPGEPAAVTNSGTPAAAVFDFDIPEGQPGENATIAIGAVVTGAPGSAASVANVGTPTAALLDFSIPKGVKGDKGEAFVVNATGLVANRALHDEEAPGFSFLATDESLIYFRLDPIGWSAGAPFGQGAEGASAFDVALANGFVGTEVEWLESLVGPVNPDIPLLEGRIDALDIRVTAIEANPVPKVARPTNLSPVDGATGIFETPTLVGSEYRSLYGVAQQACEIQVSTAEDMSAVFYTRSGGAVTQLAVAAGVLVPASSYWWQIRYRDADGVWSGWSAATDFATNFAFVVVATPTGISPDGTAVGPTPTLSASAFAVSTGADTHAASQWQVATDAAFTNLVRNPGDNAVNKTSWLVAPALNPTTTYYWRVRYKGTSGVYSAWSTGKSFSSAVPAGSQTFTSSGTFTVPANVTSVRVVVIGGGGGGASDYGSVALGRVGGVGGTSSFGGFCSATGGKSNQTGMDQGPDFGTPGGGIGGDVNHNGGFGGPQNATTQASANGGPGQGHYSAGGGGGAGVYTDNNINGNGGLGGGHALTGKGGNSGRASLNATPGANYGGGGAGGGANDHQGGGGGGGGGGAMKVCAVAPGDAITVTVGAGGAAPTSSHYGGVGDTGSAGAPGVVFVEWGY